MLLLYPVIATKRCGIKTVPLYMEGVVLWGSNAKRSHRNVQQVLAEKQLIGIMTYSGCDDGFGAMLVCIPFSFHVWV